MDGDACYVTIADMNFAARFRQARLDAGLTQQEVANACGVTDGAVSAWEKGVASGISAETLFAAADVMRCEPRWLATGVSGPDLAELARDFSTLPANQRDVVRQLIKTLKR